MQKLSILFLITLCVFSCKKKEETPKNIEVEQKIEKVVPKESSSNSKIDFLQGSWQNIDDPKSKMSFKGNLWIDTYEGMKEISKNTFEINDQCANVTQQNAPKLKDGYISIAKLKQCYKIVKVDKEYLELSYVGRGNSLKYKRINE